MITPTIGNIIIEPVVHESFIASQKETYDEIGVVIAIYDSTEESQPEFGVGDKVFFDSWLAAKYPKNETEYYWLVKVEDIRAYEKQVSEK